MALPFMMVGLFPKASRRVDRACHLSTAEDRPRGSQKGQALLALSHAPRGPGRMGGPARSCSPSTQRLLLTPGLLGTEGCFCFFTFIFIYLAA